MFTGIIESLGKISAIEKDRENYIFQVASPISQELKIDQSISHDGACLTVTKVGDGWHRVTAILETLRRTNLSDWKVGTLVNLERCMLANGRFDGHIVQGHVDQTGICTGIVDELGSWLFTFEYDASEGNITVQKGSVCVNGVSLTVAESGSDFFKVAIIPYTYENTGFKHLNVGGTVNLEFDILGKYVQKMLKGQQYS